MSRSTTVTPLSTYRNESPYPFCPGCGHSVILDRLNAALVELSVDPREVVLVSDIGCAGLSDQYFDTNAFHGLHGRSITYACGIKLARPDLTVLVVMGDGGTGIGGTHLVNAARRNIGITVLVFNNMNFGMTGGQHSTTTPTGALTSTTPTGNLEAPLDICGTVAVNGAGYVYRGTSFDRDLPQRIAEAVESPGFALLDIWEMCTAYFVPGNRFSRKQLYATLESLELTTGVIRRRRVEDYGAAYRAAHAPASDPAELGLRPRPLEPQFRAKLDRRYQLVVAGSAGQKVRSAVRLAARAAILSGLWAAQRDDYPVTVQTGHSLSELVLDTEPFDYSGVERPDALLVLSPDGAKKAGAFLRAMAGSGRLFGVPDLPGLGGEIAPQLIEPTSADVRLTRHNRALVTLAAALGHLGLFPGEALEEAARSSPAAYRESNVEAVRAGLALAERR